MSESWWSLEKHWLKLYKNWTKAHPYHMVGKCKTETDSAWDLHFVSSRCQAGRWIHNWRTSNKVGLLACVKPGCLQRKWLHVLGMICPQFSGAGISGYKKVCTVKAQVLWQPGFLETERIINFTDLFYKIVSEDLNWKYFCWGVAGLNTFLWTVYRYQ